MFPFVAPTPGDRAVLALRTIRDSQSSPRPNHPKRKLIDVEITPRRSEDVPRDIVLVLTDELTTRNEGNTRLERKVKTEAYFA